MCRTQSSPGGHKSRKDSFETARSERNSLHGKTKRSHARKELHGTAARFLYASSARIFFAGHLPDSEDRGRRCSDSPRGEVDTSVFSIKGKQKNVEVAKKLVTGLFVEDYCDRSMAISKEFSMFLADRLTSICKRFGIYACCFGKDAPMFCIVRSEDLHSTKIQLQEMCEQFEEESEVCIRVDIKWMPKFNDNDGKLLRKIEVV